MHFIERAPDWDELRGATANMSLFGARRLVEIRLASGKAGVAGNAALVALLARPDPDTLFLVLAPRLDRDAQGAQWVRAVEAGGAWVQIWPVDSARLVGWLRSRARKLGLDMNEEALELLAARTEGNLLAAHQELTKLTLLGGAAGVTADVVFASVADSARFDVFQLSEAVLTGETPRALRMLAGLRAEGTSRRWRCGPSPRRCAMCGMPRRAAARVPRHGSARRRRWRRRSGARRAFPSPTWRAAPRGPIA